MRTKVFGKNVENTYEVDYKWKSIKDENGEDKTVYTDKPTITKTSKVKNWVELCSYEGEPRYNSKNVSIGIFGWVSNEKTVNISEDECVVIEEEIFRADINEMHLHTDKVIQTFELNKEDTVDICKYQIKAFNEMMIKSNSKLMAYCDLHKLVYEDTDAIELFKLVFPDEEYVIEDGVMKVKEKPQLTTVDSVYVTTGYLPINGTALSGTICGRTCSGEITSRG